MSGEVGAGMRGACDACDRGECEACEIWTCGHDHGSEGER